MNNNKKFSTPYRYHDTEISKVNLDKNIIFRIIENEAGKFVDIRKYENEVPTVRGIRITLQEFKDLLASVKGVLDATK